MAKAGARPIIDMGGKKGNLDAHTNVRPILPGADPGFKKKPATRQVGKALEVKGTPGGPTHSTKKGPGGIGGPPRKGQTNTSTRKNSVQGSDSTTAGSNRGKRSGGGDTAKIEKRPVA